MRVLGKYWKLFLALILLLIAIYVYFLVYRPAYANFLARQEVLTAQMRVEEANLQQNLGYADVQERLVPALEELAESRSALYDHFPLDMREEDQILYILDLEERFGNEIAFEFGDAATVPVYSAGQPYFNDGAVLRQLPLTVNYETTYAGFKEMVDYLANDPRLSSVQTASMYYDAENDVLRGYITISRYLIYRPGAVYEEPEIPAPGTVGKENLYDYAEGSAKTGDKEKEETEADAKTDGANNSGKKGKGS